MIRHITKSFPSQLQRGTFTEFLDWFFKQQEYQIDIETNITDWWYDKKLISIQFGSASIREDTQWFLQWSALNFMEQQQLKDILNHDNRVKYAHNGKFEYNVLYFHGIILEHIFDTMLAEKVIRGGTENDEYALADISYKYLRIIMDKSLQMSFGDDEIDDPKIIYGITDVKYLGTIKRLQLQEATELGLLNVLGLEMDVLPAFCDITCEGMILNKQKWRENIVLAEPIVEKHLNALNEWLTKEPFKSYAESKGYIAYVDRITANFKSWQQREKMLQIVFPDIIGASGPVVKKYIRDNSMRITGEQLSMLVAHQEKDYQPLCDYMVAYHYKQMVSLGYLIPANTVTINWNSVDQVLPMIQLVEPKMKSLDEESRGRATHKILKSLEEYKSALKLIGSLGEEFIHKYVSPDDKIRPNFNQIISTGRCSSSNYNQQNVVAGDRCATDYDPKGLRYRNCFGCEEGWTFVDGDYVSQELVILAYMSRDPVWMEAIEKGWDLHSICAELMYKSKWKNAAKEDCAYYRMEIGSDGVLTQAKQKCKCLEHQSMRYDIKSIGFGLIYGMTEFKLSSQLEIGLKEAKALMQEYFRTFPLIGDTLKWLGEFGVRNGYIMTLYPFKRRRMFKYWREYAGYIEPFLSGAINIPTLGEIERASKNHPIQGSSADIVKTAMVLIRNYIKDYKLRDRVRFQANVHDQITTKARNDFKDEWKPILNQLMWEAGNLVIPTGILKVDVQESNYWTK
jgi:DNA polymerase I-like protein with 3'-5' exonuclease and polymerase domains